MNQNNKIEAAAPANADQAIPQPRTFVLLRDGNMVASTNATSKAEAEKLWKLNEYRAKNVTAELATDNFVVKQLLYYLELSGDEYQHLKVTDS